MVASSLIERLLPPPVATAERFTDPPEATLFPEEAAVVARAVAKRRIEFTTARHCARIALAAVGAPVGPILPGERGAPQWPTGFVGSLTHCDGYRAAAVARAADVLTLGLDAEPNLPLPEGVLGLVSRPEEGPHLLDLAARRPDVCWDRLLFCVKETVYKGWFPLAQRWLGFEDATVTLREDGTFTADLLVPGPVATFDGQWLVGNDLILAALTIRRP